mgnify:CR=1 FL=1
MLNVHWRQIVSALGLSLMLLAIVGCGQSSQPLPDIDATVEARVEEALASICLMPVSIGMPVVPV